MACRIAVAVTCCCFPWIAAGAYPAFQMLVDAAAPGTVLTPPPGRYAGPVILDKPLTIDGRSQVTLDGGGQGSVVVLHTSGATLQGLHLTNSGQSHNDLDAGIQVRGNFNSLKDNQIDDCLFGIDLQQSEDNIVRHNRISSKPLSLGLRGDAIRLWYSFRNQITDNVIRDSRDTVVWYSRDNLIARNDARGGRYSLHFMYAQHNEVLDNHYEDNSVGIFLMYSDGVEIKRNTIARSAGPTGIGIGLNETSDVTIENNQILHNAVGIYLDVSPYQPDTTNRLRGNLVAYNGIGVRFHNDWHSNQFEGNHFKGNLTQVAVDGGESARRNEWHGNNWDDYEGFDRNYDGIGDTPYRLYSYADRLWMDVPPAQFFKGSPMLETLDFLERLAPFSEPILVLQDERPLMIVDRDTATRAMRPKPPAASAFDALEVLRGSLGRD
ncbi:MAG: nitrous oxide reductase family maturation protein NosD [Pseudomonadota bacterium]